MGGGGERGQSGEGKEGDGEGSGRVAYTTAERVQSRAVTERGQRKMESPKTCPW